MNLPSRLLIVLLAVLAAGATAGPARAQPADPFGSRPGRMPANPVTIDLAWREAAATPGTTATLGVILRMAPRWHVQAGLGSGDEVAPYIPTSVDLDLPDGWTAGEPVWPVAHRFALGTGADAETLNGYEGTVLVAVPVTIPAGTAPGDVPVRVSVGYQACDDRQCQMPTSKTKETVARVGGDADAPDEAIAALFDATLGADDETPTFAEGETVRVGLAWSEGAVRPGATTHLGVIFEIAPNWHVQAGAGSGDERDDFIATTIEPSLPEGWTAGPAIWPEAHEFTSGPGAFALVGAGYEDTVLVAVPVTVPADAAPGAATIPVSVTYQACDDMVCEFPMTLDLEIETTVVDPAGVTTIEPPDRRTAGLFAALLGPDGDSGPGAGTAADGGATGAATPDGAALPVGIGGLVVLVLLGLVGGFILNFTPCVLPIIPLKIMGLANSAGNRARTFALGVAMSLGIVAFFMVIGIAIASFNQFTTVNQLFNYPIFTIGIGLVIAGFAIGMCGLFSIPLPRFVYGINPSHESFPGSFAFGVMTAILSTPCTAPFMGSAMAASVGQSATIVLIVFASVGVGMALPYLVLSAYPHLVDRMPRSGPSGELIKQVMGLFMLAAAAFFIGSGVSGLLVDPPAPPSRLYWWPVFLLSATASAWLLWRTLRLARTPVVRTVFVALGVLGVAGSLYGGSRLSKPDTSGPIAWTYYTPEEFRATLDAGHVAVVDFTAEWCLNCKLLEKNVLEQSGISERLAADDVVPIKVDLTGNNVDGRAILEATGSVTIPWLVIYSPSGEVVFAQNWYTPEMVLDGIERARSGGA